MFSGPCLIRAGQRGSGWNGCDSKRSQVHTLSPDSRENDQNYMTDCHFRTEHTYILVKIMDIIWHKLESRYELIKSLELLKRITAAGQELPCVSVNILSSQLPRLTESHQTHMFPNEQRRLFMTCSLRISSSKRSYRSNGEKGKGPICMHCHTKFVPIQ